MTADRSTFDPTRWLVPGDVYVIVLNPPQGDMIFWTIEGDPVRGAAGSKLVYVGPDAEAVGLLLWLYKGTLLKSRRDIVARLMRLEVWLKQRSTLSELNGE